MISYRTTASEVLPTALVTLKSHPNAINEIKELMKEVREKHTYINRIDAILGCFK